MSSVNSLPEFDRISPGTYYRPSRRSRATSTSPEAQKAISLIVVCSWTAANPRHVAKYVQGYDRLFPGASILVVQTSSYDVIARVRDAWHLPRLAAARKIITSHRSNGDGGVLLHAFSNGGALTASLMVESLLPADLPAKIFDAVIFDSCPGQGHYWQTVQAAKTTLSINTYRPAMYYLISAAIHLLIFGFVLPEIFGFQNSVSRTRIRLNNKTVMSMNAPRLYIYSRADPLIHWADVQDHISEASRVGYTVHEVAFQESGHCSHAMYAPEKYWDAVSRFINTK